MSIGANKRILIVDDHELVRRGVRSLLATEPTLEVCGEAINGWDAIHKAISLRPDIVVMDISMPEMNGLDATREIKQKLPQTKIIIVSQYDAPEMARQAFSAGALGYIAKSTISNYLLAAIARIDRREAFHESATVGSGNSAIDLAPPASGAAHGKRWDADLNDLGRLLDLSLNAVIVRDAADDRITYWNRGAAELYGWTHEEAIGQVSHSLFHTRFPRPFETISERLRHAQGWEGELTHVCKNGAQVTVLSRWALLRHSASRSESVVEINIDITQRREAERELYNLVRTLDERVAERTKDLLNARNEHHELSACLLKSQDEERRRIARELHDGVGQLLAAMNMNLFVLLGNQANLNAAAEKSVRENIALVDQASQDLRSMSHRLHPPLLDEVGLASALEWYVHGFAEESNIAVSLELAPSLGHFSRDVELSLFRIVQECLTNVHRHSDSPTARVRLYRVPGEVRLEVKDEGRGIPLDVQLSVSSGMSSGVGLPGIRERARQFGGRLDIQSSERGTAILAILPTDL